MALTVQEESTDSAEISARPPAVAAEFKRERADHNGGVGHSLVSESERVAGEHSVHHLQNIGDREMVFMTVEFLESAKKPLAIPVAA